MSNLIDLTKKAGIVLEKKNLSNVKAEIVLVIDRSGSMSERYANGTVQQLVDRLLGIGMNMDVNKEIEVYQFNTGVNYVGTATAANHDNFVQKKKMTVSGGTNYAPAMKEIVAKYGTSAEEKKGLLGGLFGKKAAPETKPAHPTFVFFITDGDNFDRVETEQVVRDSAKQAIFWQFVGIGNESFKFLQKLDDLSGRHVDNADFFKVADVAKVSDEELYEKLLTEFPGWLTEIKSKGMLA